VTVSSRKQEIRVRLINDGATQGGNAPEERAVGYARVGARIENRTSLGRRGGGCYGPIVGESSRVDRENASVVNRTALMGNVVFEHAPFDRQRAGVVHSRARSIADRYSEESIDDLVILNRAVDDGCRSAVIDSN